MLHQPLTDPAAALIFAHHDLLDPRHPPIRIERRVIEAQEIRTDLSRFLGRQKRCMRLGDELYE